MNSTALTVQQTDSLTRATPSSAFVMYALEPVWVPHPADYVPKAGERAAHHGGPDGEASESGKWRLRFPTAAQGMDSSLAGQIYDGPTISPSALDTSAECVNKWGLDRIVGLEKPANESADLGTLTHGDLEGWQKYGKRPTIEGMAKVIEKFPMPGQGEAECYIGFVFGRPGHEVVFAGYIDARVSATADDVVLQTEDDGVIDIWPAPLNSTIYDLKTTGDFRWKKTAAQLKANIQSALYALGEMLRVEAKRGRGAAGTELCILKWVYALRKVDSKTKVLSIGRVEMTNDDDAEVDAGTVITREQAVTVMAQYLPLAERLVEIIRLHEKKEQVQLPKNTDACASYGGCSWKKLQIDSKEVRGVAVPVWACEPPVDDTIGSGFKALRRQAQRKAGLIGDGDGLSEKVLVQIGAAVVENKNTSGVKMTSTGLGARFGKKLNGAPAAVSAAPGAVVAASVAPTTAVAPAAAVVAAKVSGGLGARFGVKSGASGTVAQAPAAPAETPKLEVKAAADGMSAVAVQGQAPAAGTGTLQARLQAVAAAKAGGNAGGNAVAVAGAVAAAPVHAVSGALAVGINPSDAAPEWTAEQQAAEAARLAGVKPDAVAAGSDGSAAVVKRGRGRPAGSTNKPAAPAAGAQTAAEWNVEMVLSALDEMSFALMSGGHRAEAAVLMKAAADIAA